MSFNILYQEGVDVTATLSSIAVYVDSFAKELGLKELQIDPQAFISVTGALHRPDFPHSEGLGKASPFKKAANFFVWFVAQKPIIEELPLSIIGEKLRSITNHQNVIVAYLMAVDCLHGAKIYRDNGEIITLENRIKVSMHFFRDFVEAFSTAMPNYHFKIVSIFFEQLAYKDNRNASYPELV